MIFLKLTSEVSRDERVLVTGLPTYRQSINRLCLLLSNVKVAIFNIHLILTMKTLLVVQKLFSKFYAKYEFYIILLFLLTLFLIKAPPFYYSTYPSKVFSSHTLGKIIIIGLFFVTILAKYFQTQKVFERHKKLLLFLGLYILAQSLTVLVAEDVVYFWKAYHNLLIGLFIFYLAFMFVSKKTISLFNRFVLLTGAVLILLELLFFLFTGEIMPFIKNLVQKEVLDAYLTNLSRGRFSLDLNVELFLPILLGFVLRPIKTMSSKTKLIAGFLIPVIVFLSFFSNFRSRALMSVFGFFGFLGAYALRLKGFDQLKKLVIILAVVALSTFVALNVSNSFYSFNVLDRFALQNEREDVGTITFRARAADKSVEMFLSSPVLGIGLGNYTLYADRGDLALKRFLYLDRFREDYSLLASQSPHNVIVQLLGETGLFGTATFLMLMVFFATRDYKYLLFRDFNFVAGYIISFWTILVFMLFNPAASLFVIGWFWFVRGVIEAAYVKLEWQFTN